MGGGAVSYERGTPVADLQCVSSRGPEEDVESRKVAIRLPGKGNSNSHGARPVHLIITIRASRLSMKNSLSRADLQRVGRRGPEENVKSHPPSLDLPRKHNTHRPYPVRGSYAPEKGLQGYLAHKKTPPPSGPRGGWVNGPAGRAPGRTRRGRRVEQVRGTWVPRS